MTNSLVRNAAPSNTQTTLESFRPDIQLDTAPSADNGFRRRLNRLLAGANRRSLVLGVDHPVFDGYVEGLGSVDAFLRSISDAPMDAVLMSPSTMRRLDVSTLSKLKSLVLRVDTTATFQPGRSTGNVSSITVSEEQIVQSGADAVTCFFLVNDGGSRVADHRPHLIEVSKICEKYGFPLIVEALSVHDDGSTSRDLKAILHVGKLAAELGASVLKIDAPEQPEDLAHAVEILQLPVFIRGGVPKDDKEQMYGDVSGFVQAGAAGIVFGRSIFQSDNPAQTIQKLRVAMDTQNR